MEAQHTKAYGMQQKQYQGGNLYKTKKKPTLRKKKNFKQPNSYLKELGKEEQTKPKISSRKEIIKIGAEIRDQKSNGKYELRSGFLKR